MFLRFLLKYAKINENIQELPKEAVGAGKPSAEANMLALICNDGVLLRGQAHALEAPRSRDFIKNQPFRRRIMGRAGRRRSMFAHI